MDGENRSIGGIRTFAILLWVIISVIFFGSGCFIVAPFNSRLAHALARLWNKLILFWAGVKVEVIGLEKLHSDRRYVFVANHQSHIDIPVLYASLQHSISFIAKKELFAIPFLGWGMYGVGHIWIDRGNVRKALTSINRAVKRLQKDNISLVLFPEGTRSKDGKIGRFKQGSFSLVKQAGVEVVPLAIYNTSQILSKHSKKMHSGTAYLVVGDPVVVDESMTKADISKQLHKIIETALEELPEKVE